MDTFTNSEYPEENHPASEAQDAAPQEPQKEAEPQNPTPRSEPQSGTYHAAGTGRRESPYANSPYMTGQPRAYQYQYQPQTQPPRKKERKSGKSPWKTVIAVVLVLALVATGCLITASSVNSRWEQKTNQITQQLGRQIDDLQKQIDSAPSGTSGALPAADGSAMTPAQLYQSNVDSVVAISCTMQTTAYGQSVEGTSSGSGFILTEDGYVVTNYHVVQNASNITVTTHTGDEYDATVKGYDATNDVAVLKVEAEGLSAATIGSSGNLSIGDMVVAIGNPLGRLAATETVGYVSGINREVTTDNTVISMLQTDAAINPGNSGGPLFNSLGQVVGINSAKIADAAGEYENLGFAIPINEAKAVIDDLTKYGYVKGRVMLSITGLPFSRTGYDSGFQIASINSDSVFVGTQVRVGDIITYIDGVRVKNAAELTAELSKHKVGEEVEITLNRIDSRTRRETTFTVKVTLVESRGN